MVLVIDIGNTDTVFGIFEDKTLSHQLRVKSLVGESSVFYEYRLKNYFLEQNIRSTDIKKVVLSSVVPSLTEPMRAMTKAIWNIDPIVVGAKSFKKLEISIDNPDEIGSDLIANAVAAYTKYGKNLVVVDFGTALTFTIVSGEGKILGVAITPGLRTAVKALFSNTAQLPEVPLRLPESAIGKNTVHAIQAGILIGYEGLVRNVLQRIREEIGNDCIVIATGGLSSIISTLEDEFVEVNRNLTLEGLRIIGEFN